MQLFSYNNYCFFRSGVARGLVCHAEHDLNFFKRKVFLTVFFLHEMLWHVPVNILRIPLVTFICNLPYFIQLTAGKVF